MKKEHPLQAIIKKYKRVANLKPPTDEQCQTLYDLYGAIRVIKKVEEMNNWKGINKKVYFYATISSWFRKDREPTGRKIKDDMPEMITGEKLSENREKIKPGWLIKGVKK